MGEVKTGIRKPIFIIGCPRSGTGILQNMIRLHPEVAYASPATSAIIGFLSKCNFDIKSRFGIARMIDFIAIKTPKFLLPKMLRGPYDGFFEEDELPKGVEDYHIWSRYEKKYPDCHYIDEKNVTENEESFIKKVVKYHLDYFGRSRFLSKKPSNSLRIRFINRIFSDSIFIHLVRDGRAVASSILNKRKQKDISSWWGAKPPRWKEMLDKPPIAQCGLQWKVITEIIESDARRVLNNNRYMRVKYEDLMDNTMTTLKNLFEFCELDYSKVKNRIEYHAGELENRNYKWKKNLTKKQKELLTNAIGNHLKTYGYLVE